MFERRISVEDVADVLRNGEEIARYPEDSPYPSRILFGLRSGRPIHVVAAYNAIDKETIVITVYEPDPALWDATFKRRRP
jgi:hypothetical protein